MLRKRPTWCSCRGASEGYRKQFTLPWEFRAGREGRAEHDVPPWAERAVATTEPPPLRSLLHQVRNGMEDIEDRSRCQLALPDSPHVRAETIPRLPGSLFPSCRLRHKDLYSAIAAGLAAWPAATVPTSEHRPLPPARKSASTRRRQ
jgi:hypothetical protein